MTGKWLRPSQYGKVFVFLGRRTVIYLGAGVATGLSLFLIELAFAYALQAFLAAIGVLGPGSVQIPDWMPKSGLLPVLLLVSVLGVFRGLLQWLQVYLTNAALETQKYKHRTRLVEWAFNSKSVSSGEITALFNENTSAAAAAVQYLQATAVLLPTAILLWLGLFSIAFTPTLIATLVFALIGLFMRAMDRKVMAAGSRVDAQGQQIYSRLLNNIKNLLLMQIYGTQHREEAQVRKRLHIYWESALSYVRISGMKYILPQVLGVLMICGITVAAVKTGRLPSSLLLSYFYLFVRFVQTFADALKNISVLLFYWPQLSRLARWWADHAHDGIRRPHPIQREAEGSNGLSGPVGWHLSRVGFSYPEGPGPVIQDMDLTIRPGETLIITGPSGAGKSTLLYLLLGTFLPQKGRIDILGHDRSLQPLDKVRPRLLQSVGYVGPESFLVDGTIYENIIYGLNRILTDNEIEQAILRAECQFVFDLPHRLEHRITEQGLGLSAGQKQRLGLARALLRNPKVLILDEATANLDAETEQKLISTLTQLKGNMTIVAATHRKALLGIADQLVQMEQT